MSQLTNAERLALEDYVTGQLSEMRHIQISELSFGINNILIEFRDTPVYIDRPHFSYNIFIFKKQDLYYIQYEEGYYKSFISKPIVNKQLYEIEDIDDVFNILEDIFDTLRPRDEY